MIFDSSKKFEATIIRDYMSNGFARKGRKKASTIDSIRRMAAEAERAGFLQPRPDEETQRNNRYCFTPKTMRTYFS